MKTIVTMIVIALLSLAGWGASGGLDDLRGLTLAHAKLPVYNRKTLQIMVFCNEVEQQGKRMAGRDAVLDLIRRDADVDSIRDGWGLEPYPLDAKLPELLKFWSVRLYSDGVILTSRAEVDQDTRMAYGDEPVFFRSPLLDLNGIGFEADFDRRTVLVKEDVNIVLRMQSSDPRKLLAPGAEQPEKYAFVRAVSDWMRIDMENNQILLVGNVSVDEDRSIVNCDRMTIFLNRKDDASLKAANDRGELDAGSDLGGVSRVLCDGNVVVTRKLSPEEIAENGEQKAFADHLIYDLAVGTVTLTGDRNPPLVKRGRESMSGKTMTLHREEQRAVISGTSKVVVIQPPEKPGDRENSITVHSDDAEFDYLRNYGDFKGNVVIDDPRMQLKCADMRIDLKELPKEKVLLPKKAESTLSGMPSFDAGNKRELDRVTCSGGVEVLRRDDAGKLLSEERGTSREAVFDYMTRTITMTGDNPVLRHGADSLSGRELQIWVDEERICARDGSKVVLSARSSASARAAASTAEAGQTVILSDSSDLNYGGNLLTFNDHVKVEDARLKLDCDRMEIFLLERNPDAPREKRNPAEMLKLEGSGDRSLSKAVCTGHVHALDPGSDLRTEKLTLTFRPQTPGAPPGMFQSDGTELAQIDADGNLVVVNTPASDEKQRASESGIGRNLGGLMKGGSAGPRTISADRGRIDFANQLSEFHGNVHVRDDENSLKCGEMYLYAGTPATESPQEEAAPKKGLDDDPFALPGAETVPARISLTDTLDLKRVLCRDDVLFSRHTSDGQLQEAGGQQADYIVADRVMVVTGKAGSQAWMGAEKRRMYADKIVVNVENETMNAIGNTATVAEK